MAYFEENSAPMTALEAMVDKIGLTNVLYALEHICRAKASHVATNWHDHVTAGRWEKDADSIYQLALNKIIDPLR